MPKSRAKTKYQSASVIETDDDEAWDSDLGQSPSQGPKIAKHPNIPPPDADESEYWKEKRKNIERNTALLKSLEIQQDVKTLVNDLNQKDGLDKGEGAPSKVSNYAHNELYCMLTHEMFREKPEQIHLKLAESLHQGMGWTMPMGCP